MKILIVALLLPACLRADDLFAADGRKNVVRSLILNGQTLQNVQIGARTATGLITIHHKGGVTKCTEAELPPLWLKALARREAEQLAPKGAAKPATIEAAATEAAYRKQMGEGLQAAKTRLVEPVEIFQEKAAGGFFTGQLLAAGAQGYLITDGKTCSWVAPVYFKKDLSNLFTAQNSPEIHAASRAAAAEKVREQAKKDYPDQFGMQDSVYRREMKAWDNQFPAPVNKNARPAR